MKRIISSIILGISIIVGVFINTNQTLKNEIQIAKTTIDGRAEEEVEADLVDWKFEYSTVGDEVEDVKRSVKEAKKEIIEMLTNAGLEQGVDFKVLPKNLKHSKTDDGKSVFTITQTYEIYSTKLKETEEAFKASALLPEKGIAITAYRGISYRVKDTTQIERRLMPQAVQNATNRAKELAAAQGHEIVGPPKIACGYIEFREKGTANLRPYYGLDVEDKDQIASFKVTVTFKTMKASNQ
jgi:hypothetical protein